MDNQSRFIEVAIGVSQRNRIFALDEAEDIMRQLRGGANEFYHSLYHFDDDFRQWVHDKGTVAAYPGTAYVPHLLIDIDKGRDDAKRVFDKLTSEFQLVNGQIQVFFSGRGFHLVFPNIFGFEGTPMVHQAVKSTLTKYFGPHADNIFDKTRIVRGEGSINKKTRKFKVQITESELYAPDWDESIGTAIRDIPVPVSTAFIPCREKIVLPRTTNKTVAEKAEPQLFTNDVTCVQKMYANGPMQGSRHDIILRMASSYKRKGLPQNILTDMMCKWVGDDPSFGPAEIARIVDGAFNANGGQGYSFGCQDSTMQKHCVPNVCKFYRSKDYIPQIFSARMLEEEFVQFARFTKPLLNLKDIYGISHDYHLYPSMFVTVMGDTKLGKTALVQNLVLKAPFKTLFLSLEVNRFLIYRRFAQIANGLSKIQVLDHYQTNTNTLSERLHNLDVVFPTVRLDQLSILIEQSKAQIVVIDTLERLHVDNVKDVTTKTDIIANELPVIAKKTNALIIAVNHVTKSAVSGKAHDDREHTIHDAKGASSIEQQADVVIAVEGDRNSTARLVHSLGSRDEQNFRQNFIMDPNTFIYTPTNQMNFPTGGPSWMK